MTFGCVTHLFLYHLLLPLALGYNHVTPDQGPPFNHCFKDLCWQDAKGSGLMAGEALTDFVASTANISTIDSHGSSSDRVGDIVLESRQYESRFDFDSAVLGTTILRYPDRFRRYITDNQGVDIASLNMERPIPDPGTRFQDLAQDSLLAGIPIQLRSAVDPESLVPSPTDGCAATPTKCFLIIPSADVFYFGPEPTNTACVASITSPPSTPTPPQVSMLGTHLPSTKSLDLADLPCPPSDVAQVYDPELPYSPILKSEFGVKHNLNVNPDGSINPDQHCVVAAVKDPPVRAVRVGKVTGLKDESGQIP
ncbi:MAG: hypothetical protein Q9226_002440 [Calogaya cf. arnoldii]